MLTETGSNEIIEVNSISYYVSNLNREHRERILIKRRRFLIPSKIQVFLYLNSQEIAFYKTQFK